MKWLAILLLAFLQASLTGVNWLILVALWWGVKQKWPEVMVMGLVLDLISNSRLGGSSLIFLLVAAGGWLVWQYWPLRQKQQLKLRFD